MASNEAEDGAPSQDGVQVHENLSGVFVFNRKEEVKEMVERRKWTLIDHIMKSGVTDTTADDWFYEIDVKCTVDELRKRIMAMSSRSPSQCTPELLNELCKEVDEVFGDLNLSFDDILERDYPTKEEEGSSIGKDSVMSESPLTSAAADDEYIIRREGEPKCPFCKSVVYHTDDVEWFFTYKSCPHCGRNFLVRKQSSSNVYESKKPEDTMEERQ